MRTTIRRRERRAIYRVGDQVIFGIGNGSAKAKIVEDRGEIGVGGRRIYGVHLIQDGEDTSYFEIADDQIREKVS